MSEDVVQKERLLGELEDLRQLLDASPEDMPLLDNTLDVEESIPVLDDEIPTLQPLTSSEFSLTEPQPSEQVAPLEMETPFTKEQINAMVDELVAEYMPAIEQKLRTKLLEALSFDI